MTISAPWRFFKHAYGLSNVVLDADKRLLAAQVPIHAGPLMAAAPTMLAVLKKVAARLPEGDELGDLARRAIARATVAVD
ncbi:MAG: hypothetical protein IPI02_12320 [Sterolibacteriaceae bacterium]|nr:hypothetical protein [Sterolibacteriaceae bacterium]